MLSTRRFFINSQAPRLINPLLFRTKMTTAMHISDTMLNGLIQQANRELSSSNAYLSLSLWFHDQELPGSAEWCRTHSDEERSHALRIFDHIIKRRAKGALVKTVDAQNKYEFANPAEAWKLAMENEQENSRQIHKLVSLARKEEDWTSDNLLQWFVQEQLEEESAVEDIYTNAANLIKTEGLYRQYDDKIKNKEH